MKLAAERYSVRRFKPEPIGAETMEKILQAGALAPTACNRQPWRVLVIQSAEALTRLRKSTKCHFDAPAALLVCCDKEACWKRPYDGKASGDIDASIAAAHMMLEAASMGVGSTWVMHFIPEAVREEFGIPAHLEPVALLVMGYPADDAEPAPAHAESKPLDELVVYDRF